MNSPGGTNVSGLRKPDATKLVLSWDGVGEDGATVRTSIETTWGDFRCENRASAAAAELKEVYLVVLGMKTSVTLNGGDDSKGGAPAAVTVTRDGGK